MELNFASVISQLGVQSSFLSALPEERCSNFLKALVRINLATHHPDLGGDAEQFKLINQAVSGVNFPAINIRSLKPAAIESRIDAAVARINEFKHERKQLADARIAYLQELLPAEKQILKPYISVLSNRPYVASILDLNGMLNLSYDQQSVYQDFLDTHMILEDEPAKSRKYPYSRQKRQKIIEHFGLNVAVEQTGEVQKWVTGDIEPEKHSYPQRRIVGCLRHWDLRTFLPRTSENNVFIHEKATWKSLKRLHSKCDMQPCKELFRCHGLADHEVAPLTQFLVPKLAEPGFAGDREFLYLLSLQLIAGQARFFVDGIIVGCKHQQFHTG